MQSTPPSNYLWYQEIVTFIFYNFSFLHILFHCFSQGFTYYLQFQLSLCSHKENIDEGSGRLEFQSQLCHWITAIPRSIHFLSLRCSLSICKTLDYTNLLSNKMHSTDEGHGTCIKYNSFLNDLSLLSVF